MSKMRDIQVGDNVQDTITGGTGVVVDKYYVGKAGSGKLGIKWDFSGQETEEGPNKFEVIN